MPMQIDTFGKLLKNTINGDPGLFKGNHFKLPLDYTTG